MTTTPRKPRSGVALVTGAALERVQVIVRVRPAEKAEDSSVFVEGGDGGDFVAVSAPPNSFTPFASKRTFAVTRAFDGQDSSQESIFQYVGKRSLDNAMKGYGACIFAYGQTSSGKTFTMTGTRSNPGLCPRMLRDLFERLSMDYEDFTVTCEYLEIYMEKVRDLLNPAQTKNAWDPPARKVAVRYNGKEVFVENSKILMVSSDDARSGDDGGMRDCSQRARLLCDRLLAEIDAGGCHRVVRSHALNAESSRSHAVLTLKVRARREDHEIAPTLTLVDLAGSENISRVDVTGIGREETKSINKSLLALTRCIEALAMEKRVPYRDSVLTKLLTSILDGRSCCTLIATVRADHQKQSMETMKFTELALKIKVKPKQNSSEGLDAVKEEEHSLTKEINALRLELADLKMHELEASEALKAEIAEKEASLRAKEWALAAVRQEISETEEQLSVVMRELDASKADLERERAERFRAEDANTVLLARLEEQESLATFEAGRCREELHEVQAQLHSTEAEAALEAQKAEEHVASLSMSRGVAERQCVQHCREQDALREQIAELSSEASVMTAQRIDLQSHIASICSDRKRMASCFNKELSSMRQEMAGQKAENRSLEQQLELAREKLAMSEQLSSTLRGELKEAQAAADENTTMWQGVVQQQTEKMDHFRHGEDQVKNRLECVEADVVQLQAGMALEARKVEEYAAHLSMDRSVAESERVQHGREQEAMREQIAELLSESRVMATQRHNLEVHIESIDSDHEKVVHDLNEEMLALRQEAARQGTANNSLEQLLEVAREKSEASEQLNGIFHWELREAQAAAEANDSKWQRLVQQATEMDSLRQAEDQVKIRLKGIEVAAARLQAQNLLKEVYASAVTAASEEHTSSAASEEWQDSPGIGPGLRLSFPVAPSVSSFHSLESGPSEQRLPARRCSRFTASHQRRRRKTGSAATSPAESSPPSIMARLSTMLAHHLDAIPPFGLQVSAGGLHPSMSDDQACERLHEEGSAARIKMDDEVSTSCD